MPLFKRTLSEFIFRRFVLKHYASNLLVDMNPAADAEFEVKPVFTDLVQGVRDECRVLLEIRGIRHVLLDVLEGVAFGLEIHVDQQIGGVMFEHKSPKNKLAQCAFEKRHWKSLEECV